MAGIVGIKTILCLKKPEPHYCSLVVKNLSDSAVKLLGVLELKKWNLENKKHEVIDSDGKCDWGGSWLTNCNGKLRENWLQKWKCS